LIKMLKRKGNRKIYFPIGHNCVIVGDEVKKWGLSDQIAMDDKSGF